MTALLYRMACPRCRAIARLLRVATLGAVTLTPLPRDRADALADHTGTKAKLLLRRNGALIHGPAAARALLRASLPRWAMLAALLLVVIRYQGAGG